MQKLKSLVLLIVLLALSQLAIACTQVAAAREAVATDNWQPAALAAPPGLMEQVVKENIRGEWLGDPGRMSIMKLQEPGQQKLLYLINTRIIRDCPPRGCDPLQDPLCGSAGCAYFGYVQDENLIVKFLMSTSSLRYLLMYHLCAFQNNFLVVFLA
jgi:hypothetical protein